MFSCIKSIGKYFKCIHANKLCHIFILMKVSISLANLHDPTGIHMRNKRIAYEFKNAI